MRQIRHLCRLLSLSHSGVMTPLLWQVLTQGIIPGCTLAPKSPTNSALCLVKPGC